MVALSRHTMCGGAHIIWVLFEWNLFLEGFMHPTLLNTGASQVKVPDDRFPHL